MNSFSKITLNNKEYVGTGLYKKYDDFIIIEASNEIESVFHDLMDKEVIITRIEFINVETNQGFKSSRRYFITQITNSTIELQGA